jgi:2-oxo-3-hexenedioate decarboxylase
MESGRGSNVLGNPLQAIAHLTTGLANRAGTTPLQEGELVTTGTITAARSVQSGETWTTEIEGIALPGITVQFQT